MPRLAPGAGSVPQRVVNRQPRLKRTQAAPLRRPQRRPPVAPPRPDSGGTRGIERANRYKRTRQYKRDLAAGRQAGQEYQTARRARQQGLRVEVKDNRYHYYRRDPVLLGLFHKQTEVFPSRANGLIGFGQRYRRNDIAGTGVGGNALRDALDLAANTPVAAYRLGSLAVHGKTHELAKSLIEPYKQFLRDPVGQYEKHPVSTTLLFSGPIRGADRLAGRVAGRAERPTLTLPGTALEMRRPAARGLTTRAVQRRGDVKATKEAERLRREADRVAETNPDRADELLHKAARKDPRIMSGREVGRRTDELTSLNEGMRRRAMAQTPKDVRALTGEAHPVARLLAENVVKPTRASLERYRNDLATEARSLKGSKLRANRRVRAAITDALNKNVDLAALNRVARDYARISVAQQRALRETELIGPDAEIARHVPYAVREMGVRHDPEHYVDRAGNRLSRSEVQKLRRRLTPAEMSREITRVPDRFVDQQGRQVSLADIRRHMAANGVEEPAYISQAPGLSHRGAWYQAWQQRRVVGGPSRTGEATRQGTFDISPRALEDTPARVQSLIESHHGFRRFLTEFGFREPGGSDIHPFRSLKDAKDTARDLNAETGMEWVPVRINPFGAGHRPLEGLLEQSHVDEIPQHLSEQLRQAVTTPGEKGPWALVPKAASETVDAHLRNLGTGGGGRLLQGINQAFRRTVLALSPSWGTGNVVEAGIRSIINRAGPGDYVFAREVLKRLEELDPEAAAMMRERVGSGHYGFAGRTIHRDPSQWITERSSEPWRKTVSAFDQLRRLPGPQQVTGLWHLYADAVFHGMGKLEAQPRIAMLGQALKRDGIKSIEQAAQGLKGTGEQIRFARAVDRAYGQYDKFNPAMRKYIALYTPFVPWFLNAVKFMTDVLPRDHPVLLSLMASAQQGTEEWRKSKGLSMYMQGGLPGFLQGTIPVKGGHIPLARYTPFGAFGDPLGTAAGQVLPQFNGVLMAFRGKDWKGDDLPKGTSPAAYAVEQFLSATVPAVYIAERLYRARGSSLGAKANQAYNPFRSIPENTRGASGDGSADRNPLHRAAREALKQEVPGGLSLDELNKRAQEALRAGR